MAANTDPTNYLGWAQLGVDAYKSSQGAGGSSSGSYQVKKTIDQAGINKMIYNVLSSDQGLAALAGGENASGGSGSTTKGLLSQDLVAKLVGELANVTAVETKQETGNTKKGTVICTELVRQGLLEEDLYVAGFEHFASLSSITVRGYQVWAKKVVPLMVANRWLAKLLAPIGRGRYEYIVKGKITFWGVFTVFIGQPICYLIGLCIPKNPSLETAPE